LTGEWWSSFNSEGDLSPLPCFGCASLLALPHVPLTLRQRDNGGQDSCAAVLDRNNRVDRKRVVTQYFEPAARVLPVQVLFMDLVRVSKDIEACEERSIAHLNTFGPGQVVADETPHGA
jgi:hypothetical protein